MAIIADLDTALDRAFEPLDKLASGKLALAMDAKRRTQQLEDRASEQAFQLKRDIATSNRHAADVENQERLRLAVELAKRGAKVPKGASLEDMGGIAFDLDKEEAKNTLSAYEDQYESVQKRLADNHKAFQSALSQQASVEQKLEALAVTLQDPAAARDIPDDKKQAFLKLIAEKKDPTAAIDATYKAMLDNYSIIPFTGGFWKKSSAANAASNFATLYQQNVKGLLDPVKAANVYQLSEDRKSMLDQQESVTRAMSNHVIKFGRYLPAENTKSFFNPTARTTLFDVKNAVADIGPAPVTTSGTTPAPVSQQVPESPTMSEAMEEGGLVGAYKQGTQNIADAIERKLESPSVQLLPSIARNIPGGIKELFVGRSQIGSPPVTEADIMANIARGNFNTNRGDMLQTMSRIGGRFAEKRRSTAMNGFKDAFKQRVQTSLANNPKPVIFNVPPELIGDIKKLMFENGGNEDSWNQLVDGIGDGQPAFIATFNEMAKMAAAGRQTQPTSPPE